MNTVEIQKELQKRNNHLSPEVVKKVPRIVFDILIDELEKGRRVVIINFGTFRIFEMKNQWPQIQAGVESSRMLGFNSSSNLLANGKN